MEYVSECRVCGASAVQFIDEAHGLSTCGECGYVFHNPRPDSDEIQHFYSQPGKYDAWMTDERAWDLLASKRLELVRRYRGSGKLLDVGAGIGQFAFFASESFEVSGTEVSTTAIRIAREKYGLDLIHGDLRDISFGDERFDVITAFHVLEHVIDPGALMRRARELLAPGGILILAVPNELDSLRSAARRLLSHAGVGRFGQLGARGLREITLDGAMDEIHLSHFTLPVLRTLLERTGFHPVEDTLDPYYPVRRGARRLVDDAFFFGCLGLKKTLGLNLYDTIWLVAEPATNDGA